ncbi:MAG: hypothetical protein AB7I98_23135 [Verrucomicrobiales bacterium]|nr:hypothetical protein [Verrucomicrobiae bacterium]
MKNRIASILLLLTVILGASICFVLYSCSQPDYLERFDKPLTFSQANSEPDIDFPLPHSSSNIYYGMYGDWQAYTRIVRFQAPVDECVSHIDTVIAWNDKTYGRTSSYPRTKVSKVARQGAGWLEPAVWFAPETITNGLYVGEDGSHKPQIWIDLDRGIFYFTESD